MPCTPFDVQFTNSHCYVRARRVVLFFYVSQTHSNESVCFGVQACMKIEQKATSSSCVMIGFRYALFWQLVRYNLYIQFFLGATKHLYDWLCPLVGWSVARLVTHSFDDQHVAPIGPLGLVFYSFVFFSRCHWYCSVIIGFAGCCLLVCMTSVFIR